MKEVLKLILGVLASLFKSRARLEAEILILRQQINVLRRRMPKRPHLNNTDRFLFVWLYHGSPFVLGAIAIVRPETIIRWHRAGFRAYWRWRSRNRVGTFRSPWQNAYVERLIGSIRRECLDHIIVFGEAHLRRILGAYVAYYNKSSTHRSLNKDAPFHRAIERLGAITSHPILGGLHHQYCRI
jgi:transposase InsO family protein